MIRHDVPRDDGNYTNRFQAASIKSVITNDYYADPANVKGLILFGHVPVPYSGWQNPDGHFYRAFPTDGYYDDMTGTWTDSTVNQPIGTVTMGTAYDQQRGANVPGDGKFDQNTFPAKLALMFGRIDTCNEPAFTSNSVPIWSATEVDMLRRYLNKDHAWRNGLLPVQRTGLLQESRDWNWGPWNSSKVLLGLAGSISGAWFPTLYNSSQMYAYNGNTGSADGVGNNYTTNVAAGNILSVFMFEGGSFSADWEYQNSYMRSFVCAAGYSLCGAWSEFPGLYIHHMGVGVPIGYSMRVMQNATSADYQEVWGSGTFYALQGDPTLRFRPVAPPAAFAAARSGSTANLSWNASPDGSVLGYHVYRADSIDSPFTRLNADPVAGTAYADSGVPGSDVVYMLRAVKLESHTGTYTNASQGIFVSLKASGAANHSPVAGNQTLSVYEWTPLAITLAGSDADGDPLLYSGADCPKHGVLAGIGANLTYAPYASYYGPDAFTFVANDGMADSAPATVTVNVQPGVTITSPGYGNRFGSPASLLVTTALDPGRTFTNVTFYNGSNVLSTVASAPFSYSWTNVGPGVYPLTARAVDNLGRASVSPLVAIAVEDTNAPLPGVAYTGTIYVQTFNTLGKANSGSYGWTNNSTLAGWYAITNNAPAAGYQGSDGNNYVAALLSLGVNNDTNRSLGCESWAWTTRWGVCLVNRTGATITNFTLTYTGKQWRDQTTANVAFDYSVAALDLTNGVYASVPSLAFVPPHKGAAGLIYNGNLATNQMPCSQTVAIPGVWDAEGKLWLRWSTGPQQGGEVSIDDISFTTPSNSAVALTPFQSWQVQWFGSATNANAAPGADADGTGQTNWFKYVAGLDPTNPASVFVLQIQKAPGPAPQQNLLFSPVATGRNYTSVFSTDLLTGIWLPLTNYAGPVTNGSQLTITDTNAAEPRKFYRINISMPDG